MPLSVTTESFKPAKPSGNESSESWMADPVIFGPVNPEGGLKTALERGSRINPRRTGWDILSAIYVQTRDVRALLVA